MKAQCTSANKALFSLLKKCRRLDLPLDIQLELFDKCIKPILLYGSEVWAWECLDMCDKVQLRFLKLLLNVKISTPTCMVLGELGTFPVSLYAKCRLLCFWYKLGLDYNFGSNKISVLMLRLCCCLYANTDYKCAWLKYAEALMNGLGLSDIWLYGSNYSLERFKAVAMQRLKDQYLQFWHWELFENKVCINYRMFKESFAFEKYLLHVSPGLRSYILRFRLSNDSLPIQKLRYTNVDREDRICTLCDANEIGDEFHYLFCCNCQVLKDTRTELLPKYFFASS
jgi:hypothetical protein